MNMFMTGLTIIIMIGILVPVTGSIINNDGKLTKETAHKWARFYAVGMTVGFMYTALGIIVVIVSALLGVLA